MDILRWIQIGGVMVIVGVQYGYNLFTQFMVYRAANRWKNTKKDKVILHTVGRGKTIPNLSPVSLKVETFLRMAKIDYEIDSSDAWWGPTGNFPWISLNSEHYANSELIVELLEKKFQKSFNGTYTEEQLAKATAVRVMLEEHFFFGGIIMWRFIFRGKEHLDSVFNLSPIKIFIFRKLYGMKMKTLVWYQGIGRNTEKEIQHLMIQDLDAVSKLLGENKFILGEEPCRDDCAIFGILSQTVWGMPESAYQKAVEEKYQNLKRYCFRMKEVFYPDWNILIATANTIDNENDLIRRKLKL